MKTKSSLALSSAAVTLGLALTVLYATTACGDATGESTFDEGQNGDGDGGRGPGNFPSNDGGNNGEGGGPDDGTPGVLTAIVRDFKAYKSGDATTNADFENIPPAADRPPGTDPGYAGPWTEATAKYFDDVPYDPPNRFDIVLAELGADGAPQYNTAAMYKGQQRTVTTHGKAAFDQWYHDTPGVNVVRRVPIELTKNDAGVYTYDSAVSGTAESPTVPEKGFFPIDDGSPHATTAEGFGNNGNPNHNYHFTVELRTKFTYRGNETFKFSGDDDVFVFINKKLVINIGGIHDVKAKEISLPALAEELGLVVGQEYPLDFFQAERHVTQSNLRIDTTLDLRPGPVPH